MTTITYLTSMIAACDAAVAGGADRVGNPADPSCTASWDHPAAAEARRISAEHDVSWDFVSWAQTAADLRRRLAEIG